MPRHTHPRPDRKHSREHVRAQRERYQQRRWRAFKNVAPTVQIRARNFRAGKEIYPRLDAALMQHGYPPVKHGLFTWQLPHVHPEALRALPDDLRPHLRTPVSAGGALGALADRRAIRLPYRHCWCYCCVPQRNPSYRGTSKQRWRADAAEELAAYLDGATAQDGNCRRGPVTEQVERTGCWW